MCGNGTGRPGAGTIVRVGSYTMWSGDLWGLRRTMLPFLQWHTQIGVCKYYVSNGPLAGESGEQCRLRVSAARLQAQMWVLHASRRMGLGAPFDRLAQRQEAGEGGKCPAPGYRLGCSAGL